MEFENHYLQAQRQKYDCLLFDLDDTLYPLSTGLASSCLQNIRDYMVEKLGIEKSKVNEYSNVLYKHYGTTMAGLRAIGYDFDYDDYHSFVHGRLPYENLKPDPILRSLLLSLPIRKVIFTNADKVHAAKCLAKLGLEDCFEGIICFETLNPVHKITISDDEDDAEFVGSDPTKITTINNNTEIFDIIGHFSQPNPTSALPKTPIICKPSEDSIEKALKIANISPERTLFFEDSVRNIQAGKRVGLKTVLISQMGLLQWNTCSLIHMIGKQISIRCSCRYSNNMQIGASQRVKGADYALESIHNMKEAIAELWETMDIKSEVTYSSKLAVEASVRA